MKHFYPWAGAAVIIVLVFGTMYGITQQAQRSGANDPQIQLAEDSAVLLNQGIRPSMLTQETTNMARSLAPFVNIYDKNGKSVSGSGLLNGKVPVPPAGFFKSANGRDFYAETWEPQNGVRVAAVVVAADKYYVLSGRSLTQVEINENRTFEIAAAGGIVSLVLLGLMYLAVTRRKQHSD
jgi:hypothetical protein